MTSLFKYVWATTPPPKFQSTASSTFVPPGLYIIRSVATDTVADLSGGRGTDRTQVVGWQFNDAAHQKWQIADAGHNQVFFLNAATGTYLTADTHSTGGVILTTGTIGPPTNKHARWTILPAKAKQAYAIHNVADPSKVLDLSYSSPQNGTPVLIYPNHKTKNQQWYLQQLDAPPPPEVIKNTPVGGKGGTAFEEYKYTPIRVLESWSGEVEDRTVVRGLQWTWDDGSKSKLHGSDKGNHRVLVLGLGEKVKESSVSSEDRVDSIVVVKEDGEKFRAGGHEGKVHKQDVGGGVLVGFTGASGLDVDRIGLVFLKED